MYLFVCEYVCGGEESSSSILNLMLWDRVYYCSYWSSQILIKWMPSPRDPQSPPPPAAITGILHAWFCLFICFFKWVLGIWTHILMLTHQALYELSHLTSTLYSVLSEWTGMLLLDIYRFFFLRELFHDQKSLENFFTVDCSWSFTIYFQISYCYWTTNL